ncbi:MAG: response regulator [Methylococcales bacterium]|nr:response regulator [Methylococcales bacterium]MDD5755102.1 response regulator [Methylococcales bacterium]
MKQILVIDDAATVRLYHRNILESAGYSVDEAINGIEALEKALVKPYDLYVVDVNMPKLDGYGFLNEFRRQEDAVQSPAIMVSTEMGENDKVLGYAAGANLYLTKPLKPTELLSYTRLLLGEVA